MTEVINITKDKLGWFLQSSLFYFKTYKFMHAHCYDANNEVALKLMVYKKERVVHFFMYEGELIYEENDSIEQIREKNNMKKHTGKETYDFICNKYSEFSHLIDFQHFVALYTGQIYFSEETDDFLLK